MADASYRVPPSRLRDAVKDSTARNTTRRALRDRVGDKMVITRTARGRSSGFNVSKHVASGYSDHELANQQPRCAAKAMHCVKLDIEKDRQEV